jgi:hypothetical protein
VYGLLKVQNDDAGLQHPPNRNLRNTEFVHMMILNVLSDLPFSQTQPLKLAGDNYIRILKTKIKSLGQRR